MNRTLIAPPIQSRAYLMDLVARRSESERQTSPPIVLLPVLPARTRHPDALALADEVQPCFDIIGRSAIGFWPACWSR